ncbi:MAG: hypothetical protein ACRYFU_12700 [Janthinobacterium lividum]
MSALQATQAAAQTGTTSVASAQTTLTGELQLLASRAAVVFSGQVISIERRGGVVEVSFRVEQAVVGGVGSTFVLREWAGLWPAGQFRYHVGERALVFMHAASAAGFASAVDGQEGIVPVEVQGADAPALLDVRPPGFGFAARSRNAPRHGGKWWHSARGCDRGDPIRGTICSPGRFSGAGAPTRTAPLSVALPCTAPFTGTQPAGVGNVDRG